MRTFIKIENVVCELNPLDTIYTIIFAIPPTVYEYVPSNICTLASAESLMASINMGGRNFMSRILTFGPTSLSARILARSSAVCSLTVGFVPLQ